MTRATASPGRRPRASGTGMTLIEVVVTLVLATLVATMAIPTWRHWIAKQELANRAQALSTALDRARTEAIKRGIRVNLCKSPDGTTCADEGDWSHGWIMHVDPRAEARPAEGVPPIARDPPSQRPITIDGNGPVDDYVSFTPLGEPRRLSGALQMGTFTVCRPGHDAIQVVIAATGRVRTNKTKTRCP